MKKFIFSLFAMLMMAIATVNAQNEQTNYASSSKFTDNVSVTVQGGVLTTFDNFYTGHTAMAPIVLVGIDKYITPWLGVGIEGRTLIGTGDGMYNSHTAFDAVNVSGLAKVNVVNLFKFNGTRRFFEPVVYGGLGWGHNTCSACPSISSVYSTATTPSELFGTSLRNYVTGRAGVELNFNLGKNRAWAVVVNPSVVWGNIDNARLVKQNGNFEVTAGVVYHFKNSNGKRSFAKAHLYDASEVAALNARIAELTNKPATIETKVVEKFVEKVVNVPLTAKWVVMFAFDSAELTDEAKTVLDSVKGNVNVVAFASPEGTATYNNELSARRAAAVKSYLESKGVTVNSAEGKGVTGNASNRVAIVSLAE